MQDIVTSPYAFCLQAQRRFKCTPLHWSQHSSLWHGRVLIGILESEANVCKQNKCSVTEISLLHSLREYGKQYPELSDAVLKPAPRLR
ncbi:hypothetical protein EYF80_027437 [Liparis tanakae]|uniref:Uncharacterized protein n=1 Tax=Liparis tanakae TaxID=230148 RepID=A0A4Z2H9Z0_9TELE|nr:hypothetical protein EYF80_027437 [Liparis tanakae]